MIYIYRKFQISSADFYSFVSVVTLIIFTVFTVLIWMFVVVSENHQVSVLCCDQINNFTKTNDKLNIKDKNNMLDCDVLNRLTDVMKMFFLFTLLSLCNNQENDSV